MSTPSITETVHLLDELDREFARLARLHLSTMQHLLNEQAEAVAPSAAQAGVAVSGGSYTDTVFAAAGKLATFARRGRDLDQATKAVGKAYRLWQEAIDDALADRSDDRDARPRCPGTDVDQDGRLGGCGNLTERYHEGGKVKYRPLCKKCRTQGRHAA